MNTRHCARKSLLPLAAGALLKLAYQLLSCSTGCLGGQSIALQFGERASAEHWLAVRPGRTGTVPT